MADAAPATKENEERRTSILAAAANLIAEHGFAETRIADVAKSAGVSSGLVIYYFGTRDRLLVEALQYSEEAFYTATSAMMRQTPDLGQRIDRIIRSCCVARDGDDSPGDWGLWLDVWAVATRHADVADVRAVQDKRWRELIERVLVDAIEAGEIAPLDARRAALAFASLLDGLAIQCTLADGEVTPDVAREIALDYAETSLGVDFSRSSK